MHTLYGWQLSYFSGKVRGYLRYKGIPFEDRAVDAFTLMRRIPRKTGAVVMPVVVTPAGEWLQDTTHIIEVLEQRCPEPAVVPATPRQQMAALLLEAWADEFWIPTAMHYRWSFPENRRLFETDAGRALLPRLPLLLSRPLARRVANTLRSYLPSVGVVPDQAELMERWTVQMLDALETHMGEHPYLLGGKPSLADFALIGPLYAHLGRDPAPQRTLIAPRPRVRDWIDRVHGGQHGDGEWLADDRIPATLAPLLRSVTQEFLPMVDAIREQTQLAAAQSQGRAGRLPRTLPTIEFPMADGRFRRAAMPYTLWMMQRIQRAWQNLPEPQRDSVDAWLASLGAPHALAGDFGPPLTRAGLRVRLADDTRAAA